MALAPIDRATLAYLVVALAFNLAYGPREPSSLLLPGALLMAALVAGFLAPRARGAGRLGRLLAEFYPLLLILGLYTHVGLVNAARGVSYDRLVIGWEAALFSGQPSLAWIRGFSSPAWSTLMHGAYLSYYAIVAGAPLAMWWSGRIRAARETLLLIMVTFYACYTIFLIFPVAGPRYVFPLPRNAATEVPLAVLTHRVLEGGSAWGTAFPSSHVAAGLVAALAAIRHLRSRGWVLLPLAVLLSLGTVYGQFHYAVDALAGAGVALSVDWLGRRAGYDSAPE